MSRCYEHWSEKEKAAIRRWYVKRGPVYLEQVLGRKAKIITCLASRMGLKRGRLKGTGPGTRKKFKGQGRTNLQIDLTRACDRYLERRKENPPGLIC